MTMVKWTLLWTMTLFGEFALSKTPQTDRFRLQHRTRQAVRSLITISTLNSLSVGCKAAAMRDQDDYVDEENHIKLSLFPGWRVSLKPPSRAEKAVFSLNPKSIVYKPQEILLSASNFAEGSSLTVVKTDARRMLKAGNVEWWFSPLETVRDLGSASLISTLIIQERLEQLKDSSPYDISTPDGTKLTYNDYQNAVLKEFELLESVINDVEQSIAFSYVSPLAPLVNSKTLGKTFYRGEKLITLFVSSLLSVQEGDYGLVLKDIVNSYSYITK